MKFSTANAPVTANMPVCVSTPVCGNVNVPVCAIQKETPPFEYCIETQMKLQAENLWLDDSFDEDFEEEETILGIKSPHNKEEEVAEIRALWDDDDDEESNVLFSGKMLY